MNAKRVLTIALLVFVGVSIIYMVVNRAGETPAGGAETAAAPDEKRRVVKAYYFHATKRCPTCLEIERLADETVRTRFKGDLAAGTLTWEIVNFDLPGNEHFVEDYGLMYSSLVLVEYENGRQASWKNLEEVWDLVWEPEEFSGYVVRELGAFLGGAGEQNSEPAANQ